MKNRYTNCWPCWQRFVCAYVSVLPLSLSWHMLIVVEGKGQESEWERAPFILNRQPTARSCVVKEVVVMTRTDVVWWEFLLNFKVIQAVSWLLKKNFRKSRLSLCQITDKMMSGSNNTICPVSLFLAPPLFSSSKLFSFSVRLCYNAANSFYCVFSPPPLHLQGPLFAIAGGGSTLIAPFGSYLLPKKFNFSSCSAQTYLYKIIFT